MFMNKYKLSTFALIAVVLVLLFCNVENRESAEGEKVARERAEARYQVTLDSAYGAQAVLEDSVFYYKKAKKASDSIALGEQKRGQLIQKRYEKVTHVRFSNDSLRSGALSDLYPSYIRP